MALALGSRLGHYEVLSLVGAGGMGEVYRARDTRLGRDVALKTLPDTFTHDPERLARFRREAQVLAALNHPHIAQIHGLDEANGTQFLVLELVDGESLDKRIARGPIAMDEVLGIARQIAEALDAAHEKGIIHRDLKPANIALTNDGQVKVLDFGLAKAAEGVSDTLTGLANSPTITSPAMMTAVGVILGTAAFMSPEQARGRAADRRSDIWAFGCVLFEMLTATRAFAGDEVSDTLAFVLTKDPEWRQLPAATPPSIHRLLRRCLAKDRRRRLAEFTDARLDLDEAVNEVAADAAPMPQAARRGMLRTWLGAAAGAGVVAILWLTVSTIRDRPINETVVSRSSILLPGRLVNLPRSVALSPDGRRLVVVASDTRGRSQLWIRSLDGLAAQPLPDTVGAQTPFWAPNNRWLAFVQDGKLKKVDVTGGGPALTLADAAASGGTWNRDDLILFVQPSGLLAWVRAAGGTATPLTQPKSDAGYARGKYFPSFLRDGRQFIFLQVGKSADETDVYVGSLDSSDVTSLPLRGTGAQYAAGFLWFMQGSTLMAQPFDSAHRAGSGDALPVAEQVRKDSGARRVGLFSVSDTGTLVYQADPLPGSELTWFDRDGHQRGTLGPPGDYDDLRLSPDGRRLLASLPQTNAAGRDLWIVDVARGFLTRLTSGNARSWGGIWSPDGSHIVFSAQRGGRNALVQKASNGAGDEQVLLEDDFEKELADWSSDGRFILYQRRGRTASESTPWVLPLGGDRKTFPLSQTGVFVPKFSPDGRWVGFISSESGRLELYVTPFPGPGGRWQISSAGGVNAFDWRDDGKEILFRGSDGFWSAEVTLERDHVEVGAVKRLFPGIRKVGSRLTLDVSSDGQRIIAVTENAQAGAEPLTLVTNWPALLKK
ncbi:MAG TPA: protein kinase [Vicinamibacterales bacterium]